jgi:OFA family oxalate/formate antiporter-like MFS transporter
VLAAGGNWDRVFLFAAGITIAAAVAAKLVLAPMRKRFIESANEKNANSISAASAQKTGATLEELNLPAKKAG